MPAAAPRVLTSGFPPRSGGSGLRWCVALGRRGLLRARPGAPAGSRGRWSTRGSRVSTVRELRECREISDEASSSYRSSLEICNERLERLLRRTHAKRGTRASARSSPGRHDPRGANRLRLERRDAPRVRSHPLDRHGEPGRRARADLLRPARRAPARAPGKASVVEEPCARGRVEHVIDAPARTPARSRRAASEARECSRRASVRTAVSRAPCRRSARPIARARSRSSSSPTASPASTTAAPGTVRQSARRARRRYGPSRARSAVTTGIPQPRRLRPPPPPRRRRASPPPTARRRSTGVVPSAGAPRRAAAAGPTRPAQARPPPGSGQDRLDEVRVLLKERRRVLAPLAEPLVPEAEVRAGLRDDLPLEADVEHGALPGDAVP